MKKRNVYLNWFEYVPIEERLNLEAWCLEMVAAKLDFKVVFLDRDAVLYARETGKAAALLKKVRAS